MESGLSQVGSTIKNGFGTAAKVGAAAVAAATTAVVAFGASSVKTGAEFDSAMSQVAATMGYTMDDLNTVGTEANETMASLRDFAMEMGSSTAFSASEAASALNYMALAGYDAETSMSMLPNVLNLAAAGGIDLASASDMVTDASSALGLSIEDTTALVDQMARTSSQSNTSVSQLGEAILTIGATARSISGGTTELNTILGVLADNGIKGAEAGTHLRNMILSLQTPTSDAQAALDSLGIAVYDSEGNMRSMVDIIIDLQDGLDGMDQASRDAIISGIFNKTDLAAVNALLNTTEERFDDLTDSIEDSTGAAEEMAAVQLDNLSGDVTLFQSALEGAKITISEQLTPTLRSFVQFGTDSIATLTEAFQDGGLTGAMDALGTILSDGLNMIIENLPTFVEAGMNLLGAIGQGLLDNLPVIISATTQILLTLTTGFIESLPAVISAGVQIISALGQGLLDNLDLLITSGFEVIMTLFNAIVTNLPAIIRAGLQIVVAIAQGIAENIDEIITTIASVIVEIAEVFTNPETMTSLLNAGLSIILGIINGLLQALPTLIAAAPTIITNLVQSLLQSIPLIWDAGVTLLTGLVENLPLIIQTIAQAIPELIVGIINAITENLPLLAEAGVVAFAALVENLPEIIAAIVSIIPEIVEAIIEHKEEFTEAGKALITALKDAMVTVFSGIGRELSSLTSGLGETLKQDWEAIKTTAATKWEELKTAVLAKASELMSALGIDWEQIKETAAAAWELIKQTILGIVVLLCDLLTGDLDALEVDAAQVWENIKSSASTAWNNLKDLVTTIVQSLVQEGIVKFNQFEESVINAFSNLLTGAQEKLEQLPGIVSSYISSAVSFITSLPGQALSWGMDFVQSFINGITYKLNSLKASVSSLASTIRSYLHFSEPDIGPLSDFHTYAPDMMKMFARGILENRKVIPDAFMSALNLDEIYAKSLDEFGRVSVARTWKAVSAARGNVLFPDSALGKTSEALINTSAQSNSFGTQQKNTWTINLVMADGSKMASWLFDPLVAHSRSVGTPIVNVV